MRKGHMLVIIGAFLLLLTFVVHMPPFLLFGVLITTLILLIVPLHDLLKEMTGN